MDADHGLVYFIRGKGFAGSATAFSAIIDDVRVCKLDNPDDFLSYPLLDLVD